MSWGKEIRKLRTRRNLTQRQIADAVGELNGCTVVDVTEEYTSKTCTRCGHVHQKLGGAKTFKCPSCGYALPRDCNGALGIMLKALSDTTYAISDDGVAIVALPNNISGCSA
jgi:putative transposase